MKKPYDVVLFGDTVLFVGRPLGLYRIANEVRSLGYSAKAIWNFTRMTDKEFLSCVAKFISRDTKIVGISATILNAPFDFSSDRFFGMPDEKFNFRINFIKKKFPKVKIVVGGAQVDGATKEFLRKYDKVDYFVTGQGEKVIADLLSENDLKIRPFENINFLSDVDHKYLHFNQSENLLTDDDVILPNEGLPLEVARGCIFACAFCNRDILGKKASDFTRSEEKMYAEILNNYDRFGTKDYYIIDDLVNDSYEKISLLENIAKRLPFDITLTGYNRLDLYWRYPDIAKRLMDIGFRAARFGIETINDRSGKIVGKGLGRARIEETLYKLKDIWKDKVLIEGSFIVGLPYDNQETVLELDEWLQRMIKDDIFRTVIIAPLNMDPFNQKTKMFNNPEKYGYKFDLSNEDNKNKNYWYKDDYSYLKAIADAERIKNNVDSRLLYSGTVSTFVLPYYLGLIRRHHGDDEAEKFFKHVSNNQPYTKDGLTAKDFLQDLVSSHRVEYMQRLLS